MQTRRKLVFGTGTTGVLTAANLVDAGKQAARCMVHGRPHSQAVRSMCPGGGVVERLGPLKLTFAADTQAWTEFGDNDRMKPGGLRDRGRRRGGGAVQVLTLAARPV